MFIVLILSHIAAVADGAYAKRPVITIRIMAVVYAIVAILGFVIQDKMLFGVIEMNLADRWLHLALAAVLLLVGFLAPTRESIRTAHL